MYPILYAADETVFTTNGIGILRDCISCEITEERNGIYVCEFKYPVTGRFYSEITVDRIIKAKPNEKSNLQLFRIYRNTKPINGVVTYYCNHISYDLNKNPVQPFSKTNVVAETAMSTILTKCIYDSSRFSAWSDITSSNSIICNKPQSARACLGGSEGSILQNWHGEYEFDNFTIKLHSQRGTNSGVRIAYGKNLTDVKVDTNIESVYTSIYPYVLQEDGYYKELPEKTIELNNVNSFAEARTLILDLTSEFDSDQGVTDQQLRDKANSYATNNKINEIKQNIEISFVQLWQTEEYKEIAALERVGLCDTVNVYYEKLGVNVTAKVILTKYDSIKERYISMQLGNAKSNFQQTLLKNVNGQISNLKNTVDSLPTSSAMTTAINNATQLITGNSGGYVVLHDTNSDGEPDELLIMDTANINTATKVWRFNNSGLGYSSTGYNGTYGLAMTADGQIVADFITTGILSADRIKAGILQDTAGNFSLNMSNGKIKIESDNYGDLDIWRQGVTMHHSDDSVATSMFLSANNVGVLTAEHIYVGTRASEPLIMKGNGITLKHSNNTTATSMFLSANSVGVMTAEEMYIGTSGSERTLIGIDSNSKGYVVTDFIEVNEKLKIGSYYYEPTNIRVDGVLYKVLARVVSS